MRIYSVQKKLISRKNMEVDHPPADTVSHLEKWFKEYFRNAQSK